MHRALPAAAPTTDVISLDDLIDRSVYGPGDQEVGRIAKVYADLATRRLRYALLELGGVLGMIVSRRLLVPFEVLSWDDGRLHLEADRETLEAAPEWDRSDLLDAGYQAEVIAYWEARQPSA